MKSSSRLLRTLARPRFATAFTKFQPERSSFVQRSFQSTHQQHPIQASFPRRWNSSLAVPQSEESEQPSRPSEPSYQLTFTCKPCKHRSSHVITKHGYHKGTVLIQCPGCKSRHVISDHLKIFMDQKSTLEDILRKASETDGDITKLLKKGRLGIKQGELVGVEGDEDIEFWDDGTQTKHQPAHEQS